MEGLSMLPCRQPCCLDMLLMIPRYLANLFIQLIQWQFRLTNNMPLIFVMTNTYSYTHFHPQIPPLFLTYRYTAYTMHTTAVQQGQSDDCPAPSSDLH
ncbi:hypothetical protein TRIATDRAFT_299025 [Trichoderma atroviride IMI 206040]|uniref:Uncharacterized protein n=1 Tax=Hypocrea atroviridis (strain ATCC 20476 / IMI 206040) TaxID=452589 RepID=G9NSC7_HYPAI|nr:uncharacterized protein TRIATDRAFT_299025 [Trichoderma atroviride IMI 206040]EHK46328.1 hypothetical protein TRIATDRAFT_299025 [Trichoderma atroviride IMI 206040]